MNDPAFQSRLRAALEKATTELLAARNAQGFWEGELSSSALSTATAATALAIVQRESRISNLQSQIDRGLAWLGQHQNADGGWGDTTKSLSNISTTTLCWAAFGAASADEDFPAVIQNAERWLGERVGVSQSALRPAAAGHSALATTIIARYGKDRTFSIPILTMCALAGRLGSGRDAWQHVIPLPFELAAFPHQLFAALRLPVVSYALPALIAIGQARHVHAPSRNPLARIIRNATRQKTLRVLKEIQPSNGGFLEATPLTSFVIMSLAGSGQSNHAVTQLGLDFLRKSQRTDGSWPIDTNLATWCTTLAIEALPQSSILNSQSSIEWLLKQQHKTEHLYTHAAPGGWAWTDLPGGVPDADDTAGALLALAKMRSAECGVRNEEIVGAAETGVRWLLNLQNRDGGIPTFCRGWGAQPFDRSSPDITAHAIRAWVAWCDKIQLNLRYEVDVAVRRAFEFLRSVQCEEGSWSPLWFGSQFLSTEENPVYGTARVIRALSAPKIPSVKPPDEIVSNTALQRAVQWLISAQHSDGSWGGSSAAEASVEETALATEALATACFSNDKVCRVTMIGAEWLLARVESGEWKEPSPIGFYFAKLWYFERLYPLIFTVGALNAVAQQYESRTK